MPLCNKLVALDRLDLTKHLREEDQLTVMELYRSRARVAELFLTHRFNFGKELEEAKSTSEVKRVEIMNFRERLFHKTSI